MGIAWNQVMRNTAFVTYHFNITGVVIIQLKDVLGCSYYDP
jgi:hypothetical protein